MKKIKNKKSKNSPDSYLGQKAKVVVPRDSSEDSSAIRERLIELFSFHMELFSLFEETMMRFRNSPSEKEQDIYRSIIFGMLDKKDGVGHNASKAAREWFPYLFQEETSSGEWELLAIKDCSWVLDQENTEYARNKLEEVLSNLPPKKGSPSKWIKEKNTGKKEWFLSFQEWLSSKESSCKRERPLRRHAQSMDLKRFPRGSSTIPTSIFELVCSDFSAWESWNKKCKENYREEQKKVENLGKEVDNKKYLSTKVKLESFEKDRGFSITVKEIPKKLWSECIEKCKDISDPEIIEREVKSLFYRNKATRGSRGSLESLLWVTASIPYTEWSYVNSYVLYNFKSEKLKEVKEVSDFSYTGKGKKVRIPIKLGKDKNFIKRDNDGFLVFGLDKYVTFRLARHKALDNLHIVYEKSKYYFEDASIRYQVNKGLLEIDPKFIDSNGKRGEVFFTFSLGYWDPEKLESGNIMGIDLGMKDVCGYAYIRSRSGRPIANVVIRELDKKKDKNTRGQIKDIEVRLRGVGKTKDLKKEMCDLKEVETSIRGLSKCSLKDKIFLCKDLLRKYESLNKRMFSRKKGDFSHLRGYIGHLTKEYENIISDKIVKVSKDYSVSVIGLEDLEKYSPSSSFSKKHNRDLSNWIKSIFTKVERKAKKEGIFVKKVNPAYTSKFICVEGDYYPGKRLKNSNYKIIATIDSRGNLIKKDADFNAAVNLAELCIEDWKKKVYSYKKAEKKPYFQDPSGIFFEKGWYEYKEYWDKVNTMISEKAGD